MTSFKSVYVVGVKLTKREKGQGVATGGGKSIVTGFLSEATSTKLIQFLKRQAA